MRSEIQQSSEQNCSNWREVTFLSVPSKILAKLMIRWISEAEDQRLGQEQAGFQKDKDAWTRYSLCATPSNSALNGRCSCTSTKWILRMLSTAST